VGEIPESATTSIRPAWRRPWPGFRSGVWWKKIVASIGYGLIALFLLVFLTSGYVYALATALVGVLFAVLLSNVRDLRSQAPLLGSASRVTAAIGWLVVFALSFSGVMVASSLDGPRLEAARAARELQAGAIIGGPALSSTPAATGGASSSAPSSPAIRSSSPPATTVTPAPQRERATVISVTDGDTIRVSLDGRPFSVRYIGVDTPETVDPSRPVEPYGRAATEANRRLVEGRAVLLEKDVSETDRFGRLLRYVYVETSAGLVMVNAELVRLGFARVATFPPDVRYQSQFLDLERQARTSNAGLWAATPTDSAAGAAPTSAASQATASASPLPTANQSSTPSASATPQPTVAAAATPQPTAAATATLQPTIAPTIAPTPEPTPVPTVAPTLQPTHLPTAQPTTPAPTAAPATGMVITRLFYDGAVYQTESDEYVEIKNNGGSGQSMAGWRIVSVNGGQTYSFPAITIASGQTCRVYTNEVHSEWCGLSWGRGAAVWNNDDGDRANLVNPSGVVISSVGYGGW
jgi:micrococcal nuclease